MLAIVQSKSFFYTVLVWRDGHGVQRIFSPLAPYQLDEGWRSIERAGRSLDGFWHAFGCTYLLVRSSVSHRTKHTNYYKSSNLHNSCLHCALDSQHIPPINVPFARHTHNHYTSSSLPSHPSPSSDNITRRNHHPINTSSPSHSNVHRNPPSPNFGPSARGLGCLQHITLVLYHAPLIQP